MKKILSLVLASAFCTVAAQAAEPHGQWGLLVGTDINSEHISASSDVASVSASSDSKAGFLAGFYAQFHLIDNLFIEPQVRYDERGGSYSAADTDSGTTGQRLKLSAKYLDIPVYAKYKFANSSAVLPFIYTGPKFGFKVGGDGELDNADGSVASSTTNSNGLKGFEFSWDLGVGAQTAINDSWAVGLNADYSWGLTNIADGIADGASVKNGGFEIYATIGTTF